MAEPDPRRAAALRADPRQPCCGPRSVESLVNDLLPFAEFLTAHHPEVTSLRELDRSHIEGFLSGTAPGPGAAARPVPSRSSAAVAHSTVLTLRNLLDDITAWGWAEAPARRLVFAADVPKLDRGRCPARSPPTSTPRLMAAVAELDDPFARTGLRCCAAPGCGSGSCSTSSSAPSSTTARPAPGCGSRSANSPPNASVPLDEPTPSPRSTTGPHGAARHRPHPAPAHRQAHRLPVHRARPPARRDPAPQRAASPRRGRRLFASRAVSR